MDGKTLDNLRYSHICTLLDVLSTARVNSVSNIRRLYAENAEGFDDVVEFVRTLGIVALDDRNLRLKIKWSKTDRAIRLNRILRRLFEKNNRYRSAVYQFVNRFVVVDDEIVYIPSDQDRSTDSGVRNFLIELGVVNYDMDMRKYILTARYASLLASAKTSVSVKTQLQLEKELIERRVIGATAEELIVKYERLRVGTNYAHKVDRVSMWNTAAGYDIVSVSIVADRVLPRFIEVKAVSSSTHQFYWSKKEIEIARDLSSLYFLYLVPVMHDDYYDMKRLVIIPDPCKNVLYKDSKWLVEPDTLICRVKSGTGH